MRALLFLFAVSSECFSGSVVRLMLVLCPICYTPDMGNSPTIGYEIPVFLWGKPLYSGSWGVLGLDQVQPHSTHRK